jgi:hypothetical protein
MAALICIFAKPPTQGEVKTRLGLAPHDAARLAQAFLDDTMLPFPPVSSPEAR